MPAVDQYSSNGGPSLGSPVIGGFAITPHNSDEFTLVTRALYVGVAGDVTARMLDGTTVLFKALPVGIHPIRCRGVNATGTTATDLKGLY